MSQYLCINTRHITYFSLDILSSLMRCRASWILPRTYCPTTYPVPITPAPIKRFVRLRRNQRRVAASIATSGRRGAHDLRCVLRRCSWADGGDVRWNVAVVAMPKYATRHSTPVSTWLAAEAHEPHHRSPRNYRRTSAVHRKYAAICDDDEDNLTIRVMKLRRFCDSLWHFRSE